MSQPIYPPTPPQNQPYPEPTFDSSLPYPAPAPPQAYPAPAPPLPYPAPAPPQVYTTSPPPQTPAPQTYQDEPQSSAVLLAPQQPTAQAPSRNAELPGLGMHEGGPAVEALPRHYALAIAAFDDLVSYARKQRASDIHFKTFLMPSMRTVGKLIELEENQTRWRPDMLIPLVEYICGQERDPEHFERTGELDTSYESRRAGRLRVNLHRVGGLPGMVVRLVAPKPPTLESLDFPDSMGRFADFQDGLVIMAGPTGSGKLLPLDVPLPTPEGFTTMGEVKVGDTLFGRDGQQCNVTEVFDINQTPDLYRLYLSDGQTIDADFNHQWLVSTATDRARLGHHSYHDVVTRNQRETQRAAEIALLACDGWATSSEIITTLQEQGLTGMKHQLCGFAQDIPVRNALRYEECPQRLATRTVKVHSLTQVRKVVEFSLAHAYVCLSARLLSTLSTVVNNIKCSKHTTCDMLAAGITVNGRSRFALPRNGALHLPKATLPLDPYVLGAWLGDGSKGQAVITQDPIENHGISDSQHICDALSTAGIDHTVVDTRINMRGVWRVLIDMGLLGNKHIPMSYMRASQTQRLAVLQGLMDTDGTIDKNGSCELTLCDERLATDALTLIRSLGIKISLSSGPATITRIIDGVKQCCVTGTRYRMCFTTSEQVFTLARKAQYIPSTTRKTQEWLYVKKIVPITSRPGRCIMVDSPDHTYLCGQGCIATSNSTTQAALLSRINESRSCHILTVEDPIEYRFENDKALFTQREVGADTNSFMDALRSAMRQDPDIIVIGEARDQESMSKALEAAETGHLVYTTMHTLTAKECITRMLDMFPHDAQQQVRNILAGVLKAVVVQRMLPSADRTKRVVCQEIMFNTERVQDYIMAGEDEADFDIDEIIQSSRDTHGMQTFNQALCDLVANGQLSMETAMSASQQPQNLRLLVQAATGDATIR